MKPSLGPAFLSAATILFLAGCGDPEEKPHPKTRPGGFNTFNHHDSTPSDTADTGSGGEVPPPDRPEHHDRDRPPQSPDSVPSPPPKPPAATGNPEYAKSVPGKPGFVTSPYAPYAGLVDVRGFAPGTELKDPYSDRTFLVPAQ